MRITYVPPCARPYVHVGDRASARAFALFFVFVCVYFSVLSVCCLRACVFVVCFNHRTSPHSTRERRAAASPCALIPSSEMCQHRAVSPRTQMLQHNQSESRVLGRGVNCIRVFGGLCVSNARFRRRSALDCSRIIIPHKRTEGERIHVRGLGMVLMFEHKHQHGIKVS